MSICVRHFSVLFDAATVPAMCLPSRVKICMSDAASILANNAAFETLPEPRPSEAAEKSSEERLIVIFSSKPEA